MIYTLFLVILGVFVGQEYNVPNIRDMLLYLTDKFIQQKRTTYDMSEDDNTENNNWQQMLDTLRQNLNM